ncbi:hypothetical protein OCU04_012713 [Sclerotinia nivalis]|uniref:Uncharacterized protein n=1 Tax=Sclerotinia nivalis TaxID=352851 RepID=A0A9X0DCN8_9HELO|nr:hypothetical protein OCU04_012713 [Sclerotinia nivalis]
MLRLHCEWEAAPVGSPEKVVVRRSLNNRKTKGTRNTGDRVVKEEWTTPFSIFKTKKIGEVRKLVLAKRKISEPVEPLDDDDEDIEPTGGGKPSVPKKSKKEKTKTSVVINIPSSFSKSFGTLSTIPEPSVVLSAKRQEASVPLTKSSVPIMGKEAIGDGDLLNFSSPDTVSNIPVVNEFVGPRLRTVDSSLSGMRISQVIRRNPVVEECIRCMFHQSVEPDTDENSDNIGEDGLLKIEVRERRKRERYMAKEN